MSAMKRENRGEKIASPISGGPPLYVIVYAPNAGHRTGLRGNVTTLSRGRDAILVRAFKERPTVPPSVLAREQREYSCALHEARARTRTRSLVTRLAL